jgi:hypothetical protein
MLYVCIDFPIHATCTTHLTLLDLITGKVKKETYYIWNSHGSECLHYYLVGRDDIQFGR